MFAPAPVSTTASVCIPLISMSVLAQSDISCFGGSSFSSVFSTPAENTFMLLNF